MRKGQNVFRKRSESKEGENRDKIGDEREKGKRNMKKRRRKEETDNADDNNGTIILMGENGENKEKK